MSQITKQVFKNRRFRGERPMYIAVAGVSALFLKEIKAYTVYEVSSRIVSWDGSKWLWIVSHFHSPLKGKKDKDGKVTLYATAISKYCFKDGRRTIKPEAVLRDGGLLPRAPPNMQPATTTTTSIMTNSDTTCVSARTEAVTEDFEKMVLEQSQGHGDEYWTWARIEQERERGQYLANCMLGLDGLLDEFREGQEEGFVHLGTFPGLV